MSISRRQLLGSAAIAGAIGFVGFRHGKRSDLRPGVVVFDSRKPASRALAQYLVGIPAIDLAAERANNWQEMRALSKGRVIAGVTGWNDYVAARGWLEARGLRVREESHDRRRDLISWTMA